MRLRFCWIWRSPALLACFWDLALALQFIEEATGSLGFLARVRSWSRPWLVTSRFFRLNWRGGAALRWLWGEDSLTQLALVDSATAAESYLQLIPEKDELILLNSLPIDKSAVHYSQTTSPLVTRLQVLNWGARGEDLDLRVPSRNRGVVDNYVAVWTSSHYVRSASYTNKNKCF